MDTPKCSHDQNQVWSRLTSNTTTVTLCAICFTSVNNTNRQYKFTDHNAGYITLHSGKKNKSLGTMSNATVLFTAEKGNARKVKSYNGQTGQTVPLHCNLYGRSTLFTGEKRKSFCTDRPEPMFEVKTAFSLGGATFPRESAKK